MRKEEKKRILKERNGRVGRKIKESKVKLYEKFTVQGK